MTSDGRNAHSISEEKYEESICTRFDFREKIENISANHMRVLGLHYLPLFNVYFVIIYSTLKKWLGAVH